MGLSGADRDGDRHAQPPQGDAHGQDARLLAAVLGAARVAGADEQARRLIAVYGSLARVLATGGDDIERALPDIGQAANIIVAVRQAMMFALADRVLEGPILSNGAALRDYLRADMAVLADETFRVLFLNAGNRLLQDEVIANGTVSEVPIQPRAVIRTALETGATALILVHNHPSGDPRPSPQDRAATRIIADAARPLDIAVHDHLIVARSGTFSFRANGLL